MEYNQALLVGKLALLDEIIKVAHSSTMPPNPIWRHAPNDDMPIWFNLLVNIPYPYAMQRSWILELGVDGSVWVSNDNTESDPQVEHFDKLATYHLIISLGKAHKLRDLLYKELPTSLFDGSRNILPCSIQASLIALGLGMKMAKAAAAIEDDPKNEFGPLRICADGQIRCRNIPLELPDRLKLFLGYLIRYPKFHSLRDIAMELYPGSEKYKEKSTLTNIQKYKDQLKKILDKATDEVEIKLRKLDLAESGYQLVFKRKKGGKERIEG